MGVGAGRVGRGFVTTAAMMRALGNLTPLMLLGVALTCLQAAAAAQATEPAAKPVQRTPPLRATAPADDDLELLEFLGSVDAGNEDQDWLEYLKITDIGKVAKVKAPVVASGGKSK